MDDFPQVATNLPPELKPIPEISVVMPARDEEQSLPHTLASCTEALTGIAERWEIIVVDDGSGDATGAVLRDWSRRDERVRVLTEPSPVGYGAAVRRGFAAARYMVVLATDADDQFDLGDAATLYPLLREAELVAGFRERRADSWRRRLASRVYNRLQRAVLGVAARDVNCSFKLFRRSFLEMVKLQSDGFAIDAEIFARAEAAGLRWMQCAVRHRARAGGVSKVRWGDAWASIRDVVRLRRTL